jgi:hypothetical protein
MINDILHLTPGPEMIIFCQLSGHIPRKQLKDEYIIIITSKFKIKDWLS